MVTSVGNIYSEKPLDASQIKTDKAQHLYQDALCHLFSFLGTKKMFPSHAVCRNWKQASLKQIKQDEQKLVKGLIQFLKENLDATTYPEQKTRLLSFDSAPQISDVADLSQVKFSIIECRETILNILKDVQDKDLDALIELAKEKNVTNPFFFSANVFEIPKIYREFEEIKKDPARSKNDSILTEICKKLIPINIDKALEAVNAISEPNLKIETFIECLKELARRDNFDRLLNEIENNYGRGGLIDKFKYYARLCRGLTHSHVETALKLADQIFFPDVKASVLEDMCDVLKEKDIRKAITVAKTIRRPEIYHRILCELFKNFMKTNLSEALIESSKIGDWLLNEMVHLAMLSNTIDDVINAAQCMPDEGKILSAICNFLAWGQDLERAQKAASLITNASIRLETLKAIENIERVLTNDAIERPIFRASYEYR